jgi:hypothetical protein
VPLRFARQARRGSESRKPPVKTLLPSMIACCSLGFCSPTLAAEKAPARQLKPLPNKCDSYCAKEHFHNVPADWESKFRRVMGNLTGRLGFYDIDIVAWRSSDDPPIIHGKRLKGGQYVSGVKDANSRERVLMVLEIPESERKRKHPHMLSVIAHEYFHVYQRHVNPALNRGFSIKWLIEGSAAVFESMYLNDFEQIGDYSKSAQLRHAVPADFGATMEKYENREVNYGTSTAMVLFACRNTGFQRMVDFWKRQPNDENWKQIFEDVFDVSVERFYAQGRRQALNKLRISAMGDLRDIQF